MRRFLISATIILSMLLTVFLSGCSLGEVSREKELKDTLTTTYEELGSTFSGKTGKYHLVAEYLYSWAKKNDIKIAEKHENYMVLVNPATKGYEKSESTVLQCAVKTTDMANSMQPLAVSLTSLLGPENHGDITLLITENNEGHYSGAAAADPKYFSSDNFINMQYGSNIRLLTSGATALTGTMSSDISMTSPSYSNAYAITMSMTDHADPFDFEKQYPNPIETIGGLLATEKSSGNLFEIASFSCKTADGYTPNSATAIVVVDDNDIESFTKKFDKSYEKLKKKFDKLEDHFVYTMTETAMPSSVISGRYSDNIISLMYTLQTGVYLQDEESGDIISASDISSINTADGKFTVVIKSRSLQKPIIEEMSTAFSTTSGLCNTKYTPSARTKTWTADENKDLSSFFIEALSIEDSKKNSLSALESSECDIFSSKVPGLNIISYSFNSESREAAMLNTIHFLESRTSK